MGTRSARDKASTTQSAPSLPEVLAPWLESLAVGHASHRPRNRAILAARLGLQGPPATLAEVGARHGLTRQRVRQIEERALGALASSGLGDRACGHLDAARELLKAWGGMLGPEEVLSELPRAVPLGEMDPLMAARILAGLTDELTWLSRPRVLVLDAVPYRRIGALQAVLRAAIRQAGPLVPEERVVGHVLATERERGGAPVGEAFLRACLRLDPRVVEQPDGLELVSNRAGPVRGRAIAALRALGEPAHYRRIRRAMNAGRPAGERVTARNLLACLQGHRDTFVRVGLGIYALAEWGLPQDDDLPDAVCRVLAEHGGGPLSLGEIADGVLATWRVQRTSVGPALRRDPRIVRVGWNRYALRRE